MHLRVFGIKNSNEVNSIVLSKAFTQLTILNKYYRFGIEISDGFFVFTKYNKTYLFLGSTGLLFSKPSLIII